MLAINHVSLGTAVVFGLAVYYNQPFFLPLIVFVVFASLLPDIDHNNSEISQLVPWIHKLFGHRQFTHSILGFGLFAVAAYGIFRPSEYITYTLLFCGLIGVYYLRKLLLKRSAQVDSLTQNFFSRKQLVLFSNLVTLGLLLMAGAAAFTVYLSEARDQILILLLIGYSSHIVGDWITKEGVPLFWPIKKSFGLRLFRTGGKFETFLGFLLVIANCYLMYLFVVQFGVFERKYWNEYGF